jgi:hypothetical protein
MECAVRFLEPLDIHRVRDLRDAVELRFGAAQPWRDWEGVELAFEARIEVRRDVKGLLTHATVPIISPLTTTAVLT